MAESILSLDEGPMSPDMFSDQEKESTSEHAQTPILDESYTFSSESSEPEPVDDSPEWKGMSMDEIYKGMGPYGYQQHPPIHPSQSHTVLFQLPIPSRGPPKPHPTQRVDKWCVDYIRMPNSPHSLYPIEQEHKPREFRLRWEVIQEALLQSFVSSAQLEAAILSYNDKYAERWDFCAMRHFFTEIVDEEEAEMFFGKLLPRMIQLALQLPTLITGAIPVLKRHTNSSISLSQLQAASLIANAFFCTFPRRNSRNPNSEYATFPHINFNRLFSALREDRQKWTSCVMEKFKCLFHYFRRVTTTAPEGTITIQRRFIPKEDCPKWSKIHEPLPPLHIVSSGTIETEGAGLLQVDFANKFVGGGVLQWGCVQEEIRFIICPELMVTMLVAEVLDDTEALIITGAERYSKYEGYSNTFKWSGDYIDETPRDSSGRRKTSVVAIDALRFGQAEKQFDIENIRRELNKVCSMETERVAFVGFSSFEVPRKDLAAIATGNWGCGAFRGNPRVKVLIQLMAAAVSGRPMVYFTFGDKVLRDNVAEMYWHLVDRNIDVGRLYALFHAYESVAKKKTTDFYNFLYTRSKMKSLIDDFKLISEEFIDNSKKTIQKKLTTHKDKSIQRDFSFEEDEEIIQQFFLKSEENSPVSLQESVRESECIIEKKKKPSLWDTLAAKESETDKCKSSFPEKHQTALDLLGTKSNNSDIEVMNMNSPSTEAKNKSLDKSSSSQKGGQKKILDFFSRKT